jgi:hypothetical protein
MASTYTTRIDLGGNFCIEFISSFDAPWAPLPTTGLVSVLFDNAPGGEMVSIEGRTMSEATENARAYLKQSRGLTYLKQAQGLNNLLNEIENM